MPIGFMPQSEKKTINTIRPEDAILLCDSGRGLSFADSFRLLGIFGASGTGKTVQAVIPAMVQAIRRGKTVLIIDPKGTLGGYARGAAEACGREGDVIEYGTLPSAIPLNILSGMTPPRFYDFSMEIYRRFCDGGKSGNMDFHASACSTARDVFILVNRILREAAEEEGDIKLLRKLDGISCTLPLILKFLVDPRQATEIFGNLVKGAKMDAELHCFQRRIENSPFHVLNQSTVITDIDHAQQIAFHTHGAIEAFSHFLEEDGVIEKFCCPDAGGFDMDACEGKIVLMRFGAGSGGAAAALCRMAIESFYVSVYHKGVDADEKYLIIDEFQENADLSNRRLSDVAFFAMAREFKCGIVVATQSYSALAALEGNAGLSAITANLNSKIFMHSEDIMTREAAIALGSPDPIGFQQEVFAATYDTRTRSYSYGIETLNDSYAITKNLKKAEAPAIAGGQQETSIEDIARAASWLSLAKKHADLKWSEPSSGYVRSKARKDWNRKKYNEAVEEAGNYPVPF